MIFGSMNRLGISNRVELFVFSLTNEHLQLQSATAQVRMVESVVPEQEKLRLFPTSVS